MYCPRCDALVPDGANFCMRCGNPMTRERTPQPAVAGAPVPVAAPAAIRSNQSTPYIIMAIVVGLVFLLGWGVSNALQARGEGENSLQAVRSHKPDLMATTEPPAEMPPSVHDWLEHLRRIEEQKNKLTAEQVAQVKVFATKFQALGPAAGLLTDPDSSDDDTNTNVAAPVQQMTTDMAKPWNDLIKDYQSVPPPPECQKLADEYFAGLNEIPAEMGDIQNLLNSISQDESSSNPASGENDANKNALKKAQSLQGTSSQDIDVHFTNSDEMLGDVCDRYNTRKWFSISSDLGSGLLSSPF